MRSAPAVQFPLGRSSWGLILSLLPVLLGVILGVVWFASSEASRDLAGGVMVLSCGVGFAAWIGGGWSRSGALVWNGREWLWETPRAVTPLAKLQVRLDGQHFLLLEAQSSSGGRLWFWSERSMAPMHWHGLRQAVFLPGAVEAVTEEPI